MRHKIFVPHFYKLILSTSYSLQICNTGIYFGICSRIYLWNLFAEFICWIYLLNLFAEFICWIYLLNLFVEFICWIYLWNLFVEFICGIYLLNLFVEFICWIHPWFRPHLFTLLDFQESFIAMRDYILEFICWIYLWNLFLELVQGYIHDSVRIYLPCWIFKSLHRDYILEFICWIYLWNSSMIPSAFIYPVGISRVLTGVIFAEFICRIYLLNLI